MISFVIPLLNEAENITPLYKELSKAAEDLDKSYEIVFIDDGSSDASLSELKKLSVRDKHIRVYSFRKNQGKAEALTFGFQKAKGEYIVTLDADLQDKPEEIGKLLAKEKEGFDVVSGWRRKRKDSASKILASKLFNSIVGMLWGLRLHDYNCGLKVYRSPAAKSLRLYGGMHRFIPLLAYQEGFTVTEVPIEHAHRRFGKSKYGFSKIFKDIPDMFTMLFLSRYGKRPLHFFGVAGAAFAFIGVFIIAYLTFLHYFYGEAVGRRPLLFMGILFVIAGFQILFTGFLADLMINLFYKSEKSGVDFSLKYQSE